MHINELYMHAIASIATKNWAFRNKVARRSVSIFSLNCFSLNCFCLGLLALGLSLCFCPSSALAQAELNQAAREAAPENEKLEKAAESEKTAESEKAAESEKVAESEKAAESDKVAEPKKPERFTISPKEKKELDALLAKLSHTSYRVREAAMPELAAYGTNHLQATLRTLHALYNARDTDPEIKGRGLEIMKGLVFSEIYNRPKGFLGINLMRSVVELPDKRVGATILVSSTLREGMAQKHGLATGDHIIALDDMAIGKNTSNAHFISYVQSKRPGTKIKLIVLRELKQIELTIPLGQTPDYVLQRYYRQNIGFEDYFDAWIAKPLN